MNRVLVGKIDKIHGINGEVKVLPLTFDTTRLTKLDFVYIDDVYDITLDIENIKKTSKYIIYKFRNINNVDEVKKFLNFYIYLDIDKKSKNNDIDNKKENKIDDSNIFYYELADFIIYYQDKKLSKVKEILENDKQVYLLFDYEEKEYLLPFIDYFVIEVDKKKGIIIIDNFDKIEGV